MKDVVILAALCGLASANEHEMRWLLSSGHSGDLVPVSSGQVTT